MKKALWEDLLEVNGRLNSPLLPIGDFNEVLQSEDRKGGTSLSSSMIEFDSWIKEMNFIELQLVGRNTHGEGEILATRLIGCLCTSMEFKISRVEVKRFEEL